MKLTIIFLFILFSVFVFSCNNTTSTSDSTNIGLETYKMYCVTCHGIDGKLALNGAKDLTISKLSIDEKILQITNGRGTMNAFKSVLTADEIKAVALFTMSLKIEK